LSASFLEGFLKLAPHVLYEFIVAQKYKGNLSLDLHNIVMVMSLYIMFGSFRIKALIFQDEI